jgi:uncharacterized membrane protein YdjX (TVP38/TMEM64 family)
MLMRLGFVLAVAVAAVWLLTHRQIIDIANVEPALHALGIWAPIGFIAVYATGTILFFSGAILSLAGGALFGPIWGTLWNLLGATLGATIAFLLARTIVRAWAVRRAGGRLRRFVDGVSAEGWRFVALMRLMPLVPFNLSTTRLVSHAFRCRLMSLRHLPACCRELSPTHGLGMPAARQRRAICRQYVMDCSDWECSP